MHGKSSQIKMIMIWHLRLKLLLFNNKAIYYFHHDGFTNQLIKIVMKANKTVSIKLAIK